MGFLIIHLSIDYW